MATALFTQVRMIENSKFQTKVEKRPGNLGYNQLTGPSIWLITSIQNPRMCFYTYIYKKRVKMF
jgi:hypothetical protein